MSLLGTKNNTKVGRLGCIGNLALGKSAKQSVTVFHKPDSTQDITQWVEMSAWLAVDGDDNTNPRVAPHCAG